MFAEAEIYCAPEVVEYLSSATDQLRDDALRYGADVDEIDRTIAALLSLDGADMTRLRYSSAARSLKV